MNAPPGSAERAPAKINLHLHLTGRRADGYHLLDSLVVFAPDAADRIEGRKAPSLSLTVDGPCAPGLSTEEDNLVLRAARRLDGGTAALRLHKMLPVASGIGGGSADAAATLRLLTRLFALDPERARTLALGLGADVPACLESRPVVMRGVGEELLAPPRLPPFALLLVNPGVPVSTAEVFRGVRGQPFRPDLALPAGWATAEDMAADLEQRSTNDLEPAARSLAPAIAEVLARLRDTRGCLLARMSGSGGTCFGIYPRLADAEQAAAALDDTAWWRAASAV